MEKNEKWKQPGSEEISSLFVPLAAVGLHD
jgi:hypothetical protein